MPLSRFDSLTQRWFTGRFSAVTEPQLLGWPEIQAGRDVLISAPTGSGKTLAAFLIAVDSLVRKSRSGELNNHTEVLYVSPLKALSNDVQKNLDVPLSGIADLACQEGILLAPIRTAVRTGDTPAAERLQMMKHAPHILVTTPESLFILLTSEGGRKMLRRVKTLILDEIHAVAGSKRGSHLALSVARLEALVEGPLQKIGLSATVSPIEQVAQFLGRDPKIIQVGHRRAMDLAVEVPRDELSSVASNEMWKDIYDRLATLALEHRTTLVFVNTRRLSEKIAHHLAERLGETAVLPHHGSLSRSLRLEAEQRLKRGELRAVVATASLELGIDIGTVDLVCQIGSPRSIAAALQRVGRAGHWVGALPKGRLFCTTRDEMIECAAVVRAIRSGFLDKTEIPNAPLDILAQQLVAISATGEWNEDDLFNLVRSAYPYRDLTRKSFNSVIEILSEGIATMRGRRGAMLHRDQVNGVIKGRRGARLIAITNGGAIPETTQYQVIAEPENTLVGTLDEDFAIESHSGDIFLLGTNSWRIKRVEAGRVRVEDAHGMPPSIPFWNGEAPGRTIELSREVARLREDIFIAGETACATKADHQFASRVGQAVSPATEPPCVSMRTNAVAFLERECSLDKRGAEQAVDYVLAGQRALGVIPSQDVIVAERFFDEGGGMQLVIHSPFGTRINRAWGLALRKRFCRTFNFELQAAATDNGLVLSLSDQHSFPLELVFDFLKTPTVEHVLTQAMLDSPLFGARWKWNAQRALAVLRFAGGHKVPAPLQRMRADDLLAACFPDQVACAENLTGEIRIPDHPLVNETIANCLEEAMDLKGLINILDRIADGSLRTVAIDTPEPSPFCHEILNANPYAYLDDAPLEERRTRAVVIRRTLNTEDAREMGALDPSAIAQVAEESWPVVRDPDELHDALLTLILLPPAEHWQYFFAQLKAKGRASVVNGQWVATERLDKIADYVSICRGWMDSIGPTTTAALANRLSLPPIEVEIALAHLEAEGQILRGSWTQTEPRLSGAVSSEDSTEFCHRRIVARIHRLTLGRLRKEIEPVTAADFMRFLCRWQHMARGTQLHGVDGLFQILKQLQGYEIPASAWETSVLPRRVVDYDPELLDRLCLSGEIAWGRLSPHKAFDPDSPTKRVRPTRSAPIAIFRREDFSFLAAARTETPLSHQARDVFEALQKRGASFFVELVKSSGRLASEVEDALWELVAAGLVTADGFDNLRALLDPKRRAGGTQRPRHSAGRWALLDHTGTESVNVEFFAKQLLDRWGVVFRDLMQREPLAPAWRDLLVTFRRMEARGEIRGGRFIAGFVGEQFARPEAVDLLRSVRRSTYMGEEVDVALADPLNLTGIVIPGPRSSALTQGSIIVGQVPDLPSVPLQS
ncbi:MAG TPA: DEAD/DEAH box helicase [Bryobacteraceae bacterium]|jgi:ATP-dependent Lhr-like helicase|nr:DEAD/DEAH box helicase [Bryobacteraceae bacterium]